MKGWRLSLFTFYFCASSAYAAIPPFMITPRINPPAQLYHNEIGTAVYQVTNLSGQNFTLQLANLPAGVSLVTNPGPSYCSITQGKYYQFPLANNAMCLIKLRINAAQAGGTAQGGPKICIDADHQINCNLPMQAPLNVRILSPSLPTTCSANISNFNYTLAQNLDKISEPIVSNWGIPKNDFIFNSSMTSCLSGDNGEWARQRLVAAANFWVQQKLNYCHHYVPDWLHVNTAATEADAGYCSPNPDLMPGSPYYGQRVRWNYNGSGSETAYNWQTNNYMWYGMDCSNFTSFIYNFALGGSDILPGPFTSDVEWQAGQKENTETSPNQQIGGPDPKGELDNAAAAGRLVCWNGDTSDSHNECVVDQRYDTLNPYFSAIDNNGHRMLDVANNLDKLQPGDLLYIAADLQSGAVKDSVTHVVIWTGKKAGIDVPLNQVAPEQICPSDWQPQVGDWLIIDSHYQGADYRVFTPCFYMNNLWGVRRVIPLTS
jgi:hypothetical protein